MSKLVWRKRYTNAQAVSERLEKRLQVGGQQATLGKTVLSEGLLRNAGAQVEARIEAHLSRCYKFPLLLRTEQARGLLASIAEKGILAEVLPPQIAENGKEGGLRAIMAAEFAAELQALCPGGLLLPGEIRIADGSTSQDQTPTLVGHYKPLNLPRYLEAEGRRSGRLDADSVRW